MIIPFALVNDINFYFIYLSGHLITKKGERERIIIYDVVLLMMMMGMGKDI